MALIKRKKAICAGAVRVAFRFANCCSADRIFFLKVGLFFCASSYRRVDSVDSYSAEKSMCGHFFRENDTHCPHRAAGEGELNEDYLNYETVKEVLCRWMRMTL